MGEFAQKARANGYRAAAMEYDDFGNAARWTDFKNACYAHGVKAGIWVTEGGSITQTPDDADFAIAELEGPGDYHGIEVAINANALPECPLAVLSNFNVPLVNAQGVPQPQAAAPLIESGFWLLTECYTGDNPSATKEQMAFTGTVQLGWPSAQAVYGIYNMPKPVLEGGEGIYVAEYEF